MASSYLTESEAPRDFRVSSTDSDGHYHKCLLCYTVKKNFYCTDCIRTGNFVHSSMPYSDRFSEKQAKLQRLKVNRKHILDRCEKLLLAKLKKDRLLTEAKQSRDKIDLLRLAIEQRQNNIEKKRKELLELKNYNNELSLKLPRYQKRVSSLGKHEQMQRIDLQNKVSMYHNQAEALAALRRARIRQLTKYIFPVYMTYDASDSIEDMEFIGDDIEEEPPKKSRLHIGAPWINTDGDFTHVHTWMNENKEAAANLVGGENPWRCAGAALSLAAQLVTLLAWLLDARLPHPLSLSEYSSSNTAGATSLCARRVCACSAALCARAGMLPPHTHVHALAQLHALAIAATTDEPALARVESWMTSSESERVAEWCDAWSAPPQPECDPPEHLTWPDNEPLEEMSCSPPAAPAPSLVTSAAASLASMWRGWTK